MYPKNLRVNADDFGVDPDISRGIFDCVKQELVNSISVIAFENSEIEDMLREIIAGHSELKFGCHLALFDIPAHYGVPGLQLSGYKDFLVNFAFGKISGESVYKSWKGQIERLLSFGISINHLDSHQHLHLMPGLWETANRLKKEFNIQQIRVPYESLLNSLFVKFPFGTALQFMSYLRVDKNKSRKFLGFCKSMRFNFIYYQNMLEGVIDNPSVNYELMVHPGYGPHNSKGGPANWEASWENEIDELKKMKIFFQQMGKSSHG